MSKIKKALLKAKESRDPQTADPGAWDNRPDSDTDVPMRASDGTLLRKELDVEYKQTRVYNIDPEVLRRNKLFSLFKNTRITDHIDLAKGLLLKKLDKLAGNCLIVTSAHPGEGKTWTSINLGISIAREHDLTAMVIDADLRNPWHRHQDFASDFFGLFPEKGLVDYLAGSADLSEIILNPGINKLTIIPAGKRAPNSAELLSSPRMEYLIKELKSRYGNQRVIIFDCPASLSCVDPLGFSHLVDGVLFVVENQRTTVEELKKAIGLYKDKPLLGVVLNKFKGDENSQN